MDFGGFIDVWNSLSFILEQQVKLTRRISYCLFLYILYDGERRLVKRHLKSGSQYILSKQFKKFHGIDRYRIFIFTSEIGGTISRYMIPNCNYTTNQPKHFTTPHIISKLNLTYKIKNIERLFFRIFKYKNIPGTSKKSWIIPVA